MDLSIVVLNYNGKEFLKGCFHSIFKNTKKIDFEVILVDNASTDGSVEYIKKEFPKVKIIENKENVGFAKGNNIGVSMASGKYIIILNNDTIVLPDAFNNLVHFMEKQSKKTLATGKVLNFDGSLQLNCSKLPTFLKEYLNFTLCKVKGPNPLSKYRNWNSNLINKVEMVSGAFFIIEREEMMNLGGFDERIFIFYEDADLCFRFLKNGGQILYYPNSVIKHYWGGFFRPLKLEGLSISYRSVLYYFSKHFGKMYSRFFNVLVKISALILTALFGILAFSTLGFYKKAVEKFRIFFHILRL